MTQKVMYVPLCVCVCVWSHIVNKLNEEKHNHTGLDFLRVCFTGVMDGTQVWKPFT